MAAFRCPSCNGWLKFPNVYQYKNNAKTKCVKCSADLYIIGNRRKKLSLTASYQNPNSIVKRIIALGKQFVRFLAKLFGLSAEELLENLENIEKAVNEFKSYLSYDEYFNGFDMETWKNKYSEYHQFLDTWSTNRLGIVKKQIRKMPGLEDLLENYNNFIINGTEVRKEYNQEYINRMLKEHKKFFDKSFKNPLTDEQRKAVVVDEINNFINAGAGCGKTETLIAKIVYLVIKKELQPERILALAYNDSAAKEINKRLGKKNIEGVHIHTFHSFGYQIIKNVKPKVPSVLFADKGYEKNEFFQQVFDKYIVSKTDYCKKVVHYFAYYLNEIKREDEFETLDEYWKYQKGGGLLTIDGNWVKSKEEVFIGNFLYLHGINYEYEKKYTHDTATNKYRQYEPDFYLTDYDIWLEHFAISKDDDGNETSIFGDDYMEKYEWKKELHEEYETKLICTFSWQFHDESILSHLKKILKDESVVINHRSMDEVISALKNEYKVPIIKFTALIGTFISLVKSSGIDPKKLLEKNTNKIRNKLFLELLIPIYQAYQKHIKDNKGIDFDDMIAESTRYLSNGDDLVSYDYVLIDEFQDIGMGRYNLIQAVRKQNPLSKTFCVGDDWQAIYRFTGGDVSILYNFSNYFGNHSEQLNLTKTFRFSNQLAEISNEFILKNPRQLEKEIHSKISNEDCMRLIEKNENDENESIMQIIKEISNKHKVVTKKGVGSGVHADLFNEKKHPKVDILILNRYTKVDYTKLMNKTRRLNNVSIQHKTIHSQKGMEADYVIIDNVNEGFLGFPNKMGEDSVLYMVLEEPEDFQDAEERRLFYVALTRSKSRTYVVANVNNPSSFYGEIDNIINWNDKIICEDCGGNMVERINKETDKKFLGCENLIHGCTFTTSITNTTEAENNTSIAENNTSIEYGVIDKFFVAGFQHYEALKVIRKMKPGLCLTTEQEPENNYDEYAIKLFFEGTMIGYIPRTNNRHIFNLKEDGRLFILRIIKIDPDAYFNKMCEVEVELVD